MLDKRFAVVDLETTGNDPIHDKIIDLSIVFVENGEIIDSYNTLLSDAKTIPTFVTELTSISIDDLNGQPLFKEVSNEVFELLDDCCFVAHNIEFDLNFLKEAFQNVGLKFEPSLNLDTVELSKIFFPTLDSYQLGALSNILNLTLQNAHRAYDDAKATAELLIKIINKIKATDKETLIRIYNISKHLNTHLSDLIFSSLSEYNHKNAKFLMHGLSITPERKDVVLNESISIESLYNNFINKNQYKSRQAQLDLIYKIYHALIEKDELALEAYTGLGKSEAILIASLVFSQDTNNQVLISTSKKILQNQLFYKSLIQLLESSNIDELPVTLLKGKTNYVNLNTVHRLLEFNNDNKEVVMLKMRMLIWLTETYNGDLGEISLKGPEKLYYETAHLQIDSYDHYYFERAVHHSKNSMICITNHYFIEECIFLLDSHYLIVDEAHQVLKTTEQLSQTIYKYTDLKFYLSQIGINNKDRLLKDYLDSNNYQSKDFLVQLLTDINKSIDEIYIYLNDNKIKHAHETLNHCYQCLNIILNSIYETNDYKALYNYLKHFQTNINQMIIHIKENQYEIKTDKNYQRTKFYAKNDRTHTLRKYLDGLKSQILISGTLEVNNKFDHLTKWFNHTDFKTAIIQDDTLFKDVDLFIPNDIHDLTNRSQYVIDLVDYLSIFHTIREEKVIVLFTNYKLLNEVYQFILDSEIFDVPIIKQNKNDTPDKLLLQYNQLNNCILLATESFTEGINFDNLNDRTIFLTKLPFPVPSGEGYRNFYKNDLPDAVFMFRQILGRIKRKENDSGRIVLFDERLLEKPYRQAFLKYFNEENIIHKDRTSFIELLSRL